MGEHKNKTRQVRRAEERSKVKPAAAVELPSIPNSLGDARNCGNCAFAMPPDLEKKIVAAQRIRVAVSGNAANLPMPLPDDERICQHGPGVCVMKVYGGCHRHKFKLSSEFA